MKKLIAVILVLSLAGSTAMAQFQPDIQYMRAYDKDGLNVFETLAEDTVNPSEFEGLAVRIGGNFAQQYQGLDHSNEANDLDDIDMGYNLATANLNLDVQLAEGVRLNLITYLSSRGHPEAWVKGGYIQMNKMPFLNIDAVDNAMEYLTLRVGHMTPNFGDAHFRRTDNGAAFHNPFVGNYIMEAFTTEIGGELYFNHSGFLAMAAMTNGEIQGNISDRDNRAPSIIGKVGYDAQVTDDFRLRFTGSVYHTDKSARNSLYFGDRAGSRYYGIFDGGSRSGRFDPGFTNNLTAFIINPFVKFHGFELFGHFEQATGSAGDDFDDRTATQLAADLLYRFGSTEQFFVGGRYNTVTSEVEGFDNDITIDRFQIGGGWYVTKNIVAKIEYVNQDYTDYPEDHMFQNANFNGIMIESAIAF